MNKNKLIKQFKLITSHKEFLQLFHKQHSKFIDKVVFLPDGDIITIVNTNGHIILRTNLVIGSTTVYEDFCLRFSDIQEILIFLNEQKSDIAHVSQNRNNLKVECGNKYLEKKCENITDNNGLYVQKSVLDQIRFLSYNQVIKIERLEFLNILLKCKNLITLLVFDDVFQNIKIFGRHEHLGRLPILEFMKEFEDETNITSYIFDTSYLINVLKFLDDDIINLYYNSKHKNCFTIGFRKGTLMLDLLLCRLDEDTNVNKQFKRIYDKHMYFKSNIAVD